MADQLDRAAGARWVGISEPAVKRREIAVSQGADAVFDPTSQNVDIPEAVRDATGGRGADVVFECAGIQPTLDLALQVVRRRGTLVNIAGWKKPPTFDMNTVTFKEIVVTGI